MCEELDETGWAWYIPLHNGTISVGVVMNSGDSTRKRKAYSTSSGLNSLWEYYSSQLKLAPNISTFLYEATLADGKESIKLASDFSYSASSYAGDHFRLVGDAAGSSLSRACFQALTREIAFIDPFFSSGVHLAMTDALSAAATISSSIRGEVLEEHAAEFHNKKVGTAYTR